MIKITFEISEKSHPARPLEAVATKHGDHNGKRKLTKQMNGWHGNGKCKDIQKKYCTAQTNYKHSKGGYGRPLGNVYICHGFLPTTRKFEKTGSKTFFPKLIKKFVNTIFANPRKPLINIIYGTE
jgi:hypothetical protein